MTPNRLRACTRAEQDAEDTGLELHTWFERDRAHVELRYVRTGKTLIEWWDEDLAEAVEDGFLDPRDWFGSAVEYAKDIGMLTR